MHCGSEGHGRPSVHQGGLPVQHHRHWIRARGSGLFLVTGSMAIKSLPSYGGGEYLFPSRPTARCPEPERPYRWDLGKRFRGLAKAAGVKDIRIHDLRHAGATILMTLGVPDPIVRKITGHRSRELERYQHLTPELRATDGESDCDGAVSGEAGKEGNWHTCRHSARQAWVRQSWGSPTCWKQARCWRGGRDSNPRPPA